MLVVLYVFAFLKGAVQNELLVDEDMKLIYGSSFHCFKFGMKFQNIKVL